MKKIKELACGKLLYTRTLEFFPHWSLLPIGTLHKYFLKIKKFPHLCWIQTPNLWLMSPELYHKTTKARDSEGC